MYILYVYYLEITTHIHTSDASQSDKRNEEKMRIESKGKKKKKREKNEKETRRARKGKRRVGSREGK